MWFAILCYTVYHFFVILLEKLVNCTCCTEIRKMKENCGMMLVECIPPKGRMFKCGNEIQSLNWVLLVWQLRFRKKNVFGKKSKYFTSGAWQRLFTCKFLDLLKVNQCKHLITKYKHIIQTKTLTYNYWVAVGEPSQKMLKGLSTESKNY